MKLKAGTYKIKYYVKAATATGASVQSGFVEISADNKPAGNYMYSGYINVSQIQSGNLLSRIWSFHQMAHTASLS